MSLLKKLKKGVKSIGKAAKSVLKPVAKQATVALATRYGGPVGGQIASAAVYSPTRPANPVNARVNWSDPFSPSNPINPMGIGATGAYTRNPMGPRLRAGSDMSIIKGIGSLPGVGAAGRVLSRTPAGAVGTGLVVAGGYIIDKLSGQVVKKVPTRRPKGITGTQLKAFHRVNSLLNKLCKTAPPISRRGASRGGKRACR